MDNSMKKFIKQKIREQIIDGQNMNQAMQQSCNTMTPEDYGSYETVLKKVEDSLKNVDEETRIRVMQKIHAPLENLKQEEIKLKQEYNTTNMTGDSMPDQGTQYWSTILSTLCELGPDFE